LIALLALYGAVVVAAIAVIRIAYVVRARTGGGWETRRARGRCRWSARALLGALWLAALAQSALLVTQQTGTGLRVGAALLLTSGIALLAGLVVLAALLVDFALYWEF
jgi:hypothetical protein